MRRTYVLRIFLNDGQPNVVAEATRAISQLVPIRRVGIDRRGHCVIVRSYWGSWPTLLPQHGPGRKHRRTIALEPWQDVIVAAHPGQFVRGCIDSDGSRHRRVVRGKNGPVVERPAGGLARLSLIALPEARDILAGVLALAMSSPGAIAFQIGPIVIRWYGILMATSIVVGLWLGYRQAKREGLPADDIVSVGQWAILAGLVGARLYEVIFNWDYYGRYPSKIVAVWEGGLAMHGGLIVGPLVGVWLARRWNVPILRGLDVTGPSMVLGQAIGRWGNFFNEEAFGRPTDLPWKLYISPEHRPLGYAQYEYFHPTFLYESIWDFAVFLMLVGWLRPRLRGRPGALFFAYIGLYSIGRFAIEALRLDSFWLGSLRVPQLASVAGMLVAVIGMAWTNRRSASPVTG
jgi:phosphatidylglycerol:prolipoprotein diacylglycerol transferase